MSNLLCRLSVLWIRPWTHYSLYSSNQRWYYLHRLIFHFLSTSLVFIGTITEHYFLYQSCRQIYRKFFTGCLPCFFHFRIFFNETPTEARDFEDNSGQVDDLVIVYIWVMTLYIHDETRYLFFSFHIPFAHSNFSFQVPTSPSRYVFSCVICFRFIHFILISTVHALFLTCLPVSIYGT